MSENDSDFLSFLAENDPLGLLKEKKSKSTRAQRSVLVSNFEEIVNFFEENEREPRNSETDIREFQLYCRLKSIREDAAKVQQLKPYDLNGLLSDSKISDIPFDDFLGDDPLNLLSTDYDTSIFSLSNVKKSDRIVPEYISRRKFCQDFEIYKPQFDSIHDDLEKGNRRLATYHPADLSSGKYYVLGGLILYLKSIEGEVSNYVYNSGERKRYDGRTVCIFDNGTMSDMLYRSLDKALQKDGYSITEPEQTMFVSEVGPEDIHKGYVYVLKSHHAKLKNVPDVYKIGSTTTTVSERIKNAVKEPTYLYAGVDIVETYRCFNIGARELEEKVHAFFDEVRLNINIPDERGVVISPREWFHVRLDVISEAINLILQKEIDKYFYDPTSQKIIAKTTAS